MDEEIPKTSVARLLALVLPAVLTYAAEQPKWPVANPTRTKPVDINSGSIEQLKALLGINEFYARIIDCRPYRKKDDLVTRKIIPKSTFNKIKDRIITVP